MAKRIEQRHRKRKFILKSLLVLIILLLIVIAESFVKLYYVNSPALPKPPKIITANPVDLSQIIGFSKFRSCSGHDFSGKNDQGIIESGRSMKMYVIPDDSLKDKLHVIKIYAPFDGKIAFMFQEGGADRQPSYQIYVQSAKQPDYALNFFHTDPLPGTKIGNKVNAGQLLAYAHVRGAADFDIAFHRLDSGVLVQDIGGLFGMPFLPLPKYDYLMPFTNFLSPKVAAEYKAAGFNLDNMTISKQYRDKHACDFNAQPVDSDYQFLSGRTINNLSGSHTQQPLTTPTPNTQPVQ